MADKDYFFRKNTDECVTVWAMENFLSEVNSDVEDVKCLLEEIDRNDISSMLETIDEAIEKLSQICKDIC